MPISTIGQNGLNAPITLTSPVINTLNSSTGVFATQNGMTGIAKAWINYNGVAQTISGSYNVSSVTVNNTGTYTFNFTTALPNANYAAVATCSAYTNNSDYLTVVTLGDTGNNYGAYSTTQLGIRVKSSSNNALVNPYIVNCVVMSS